MAKYNFTMLYTCFAQFFMFGLLTDIADLSFSSRVKASDHGMLGEKIDLGAYGHPSASFKILLYLGYLMLLASAALQ